MPAARRGRWPRAPGPRRRDLPRGRRARGRRARARPGGTRRPARAGRPTTAAVRRARPPAGGRPARPARAARRSTLGARELQRGLQEAGGHQVVRRRRRGQVAGSARSASLAAAPGRARPAARAAASARASGRGGQVEAGDGPAPRGEPERVPALAAAQVQRVAGRAGPRPRRPAPGWARPDQMPVAPAYFSSQNATASSRVSWSWAGRGRAGARSCRQPACRGPEEATPVAVLASPCRRVRPARRRCRRGRARPGRRGRARRGTTSGPARRAGRR